MPVECPPCLQHAFIHADRPRSYYATAHRVCYLHLQDTQSVCSLNIQAPCVCNTKQGVGSASSASHHNTWQDPQLPPTHVLLHVQARHAGTLHVLSPLQPHCSWSCLQDHASRQRLIHFKEFCSAHSSASYPNKW